MKSKTKVVKRKAWLRLISGIPTQVHLTLPPQKDFEIMIKAVMSIYGKTIEIVPCIISYKIKGK